MIVTRVRVRDFKSITDSGEVRIDAGVTCLVGKNESGKTAFLEPLYRLKPLPTGHPDKFNGLRDFPRARYTAERGSLGGKSPIEAAFELDDADVDILEAELNEGAVRSREISVWRRYNNQHAISVGIDEGALVKKLLAESAVDPAMADGAETVAALREKLTATDAPAEAITALLSKIKDLDPPARARKAALDRVPAFLYFDEYSVLPGRVSIPLLQSRAEESLEAGERTALSLLRLAGVDTEDFAEEDYEARKAALEAASAAITKEVFEYWSQNRELQVELDLDFKAPPGAASSLHSWRSGSAICATT